MKNLSERVQLILADMDGPEHGKKTRLAANAECGRATVGQWLSKPDMEMNYKHARNIEIVMGYNTAWLITGEGESRGRAAPAAPATSAKMALIYVDEEEMELLTNYRRSAPKDKEYIKKSARLTDKVSVMPSVAGEPTENDTDSN